MSYDHRVDKIDTVDELAIAVSTASSSVHYKPKLRTTTWANRGNAADYAGEQVFFSDLDANGYSNGVNWVVTENSSTERDVATRCGIHTSTNTTSKQTMSRSRHYIRADNIKSFKLVFVNWRGVYNTGEVGLGGTLDIKVAVETSGGIIVPVTFSGATIATIADGGEVISDAVDLSVAKGDYIYVRTYTSSATGIIYYGRPSSTAHGEAMSYGVTTTDKVLNGTIADSAAGIFTPIAIIGMSSARAIALVGDSRVFGQIDTYTGSKSNDLGQLAKSIGPFLPYINFGVASESAFRAKTQYAKRASLISRFCTHTICALGRNDVELEARTSAQAWTDLQALWALITTPIWQCTLTPNSTSTDAFATTTNQTTSSGNTKRVELNTLIRTTSLTDGIFEIADVCESSRDSGLWKAPGYTSDGIHELALANIMIKNSNIIPPGTFI